VLNVPPLRDRTEDLPALVKHFLAETRRELEATPQTLEVLGSYDWPGNVRELRNVITAAAAMADGTALEPRHLLFFRPHQTAARTDMLPLAGQSLEALEKAAIEQTLRQCDGNKTKAARALGIAASTLYEKIKKYGLGSE
jgi:DNA-binding NtrC family response regulator